MGRLSIQEAEDLHKAGVLDDNALDEMRSKGLVGTKRRGSRLYLKPKNGSDKRIYPTLYFAGLGKGAKYDKDMLAIKDGFAKLIKPYTITNNTK